MSDELQLAAAQERFVSALVAGDELPAGFDARGARATSVVLLTKRRKAMAHVVPMIPRVIGANFVAQFERFARAIPRRTNGSALDDAIAFLGWLRRSNALPAELRFLAIRLRWQRAIHR